MNSKFVFTIQRLLSSTPRFEACIYACHGGFQTRGMSTNSQQLNPMEVHQAVSDLPNTRKQIDPEAFKNAVIRSGINFFCGVPDSLLKHFCAVVSQTVSPDNHIITVNEGSAVAMATGYHLSTGKSAMVFLQNSGLGNIVNPMMSLASSAVYSIPMLLLIGWRGQTGVKDEPQHMAQGQITPQMLELMNIPCEVLPQDLEQAEAVLDRAATYMAEKKSAYSILVQAETFSSYTLKKEKNLQFPMMREEALKVIVDRLESDDIIVSSTGMLSRELFEYRAKKGSGHARDFLTVGSMGYASSIAFSIAKQKPDRKVFCLDGDGAALMHMGAMATIGQSHQTNFKHIVFNNGAHDSVGGQPTLSGPNNTFSFRNIAQACGYKQAWITTTEHELAECMDQLASAEGPVLLQVDIRLGHRTDLGRPTRTPVENKNDFMQFLQNARN
ncbi:phosphonopyruvate decarboxylase-like [Gigantopelta aegis]|uniref:phosphonopyruvate decarboxylase-like n=1 Tax=Gigantopelta aegis TaxID=1735272 RepID=UPI001B88BF45|nr:phosphonopyruvate decarboxylase-like [Gigantopelta aegis]XP_041367370.1 phosphonopyruvate decarboxylase-like [Gigantopelta aegis]